jgi:AcrR family transcriptional regulator
MSGPRWRRRKEARPSEILAAALEVFAQKGFAGARLEHIAARAGVSKGALYLYFETKEDLFRAVVHETVAPNIEPVRLAVAAHPGPFADLARLFLGRLAALAGSSRFGAVAKMVIGESRNFPDLARVWHDEVASQAMGVLIGAVQAGQARGEVRSGDPRLHAFSLAGPMLMAVLWGEVFVPVGAAPVDLQALAAQHAETALRGLLESPGS